ncbi:MAG: type II toxin-antitoxin system RelE/ParE family toxin, partial [Firmicutes bacterium]|nr:type II toxin-antitoxin system RelE/ParE family toxin [Bacillota bacterium]
YRIYVGNYTVFYVVIGDVMEVRRFIYSRRNFDRLL